MITEKYSHLFIILQSAVGKMETQFGNDEKGVQEKRNQSQNSPLKRLKFLCFSLYKKIGNLIGLLFSVKNSWNVKITP